MTLGKASDAETTSYISLFVPEVIKSTHDRWREGGDVWNATRPGESLQFYITTVIFLKKQIGRMANMLFTHIVNLSDEDIDIPVDDRNVVKLIQHKLKDDVNHNLKDEKFIHATFNSINDELYTYWLHHKGSDRPAKVMVCCKHGRQRSRSLVMAYKTTRGAKCTYDDAWKEITRTMDVDGQLSDGWCIILHNLIGDWDACRRSRGQRNDRGLGIGERPPKRRRITPAPPSRRITPAPPSRRITPAPPSRRITPVPPSRRRPQQRLRPVPRSPSPTPTVGRPSPTPIRLPVFGSPGQSRRRPRLVRMVDIARFRSARGKLDMVRVALAAVKTLDAERRLGGGEERIRIPFDDVQARMRLWMGPTEAATLDTQIRGAYYSLRSARCDHVKTEYLRHRGEGRMVYLLNPVNGSAGL